MIVNYIKAEIKDTCTVAHTCGVVMGHVEALWQSTIMLNRSCVPGYHHNPERCLIKCLEPRHVSYK